MTRRAGLVWLLVGVLAVNVLETSVDNWLGVHSLLVTDLRDQLAHAMEWVEGPLTFRGHAATNDVAAYGYSLVYFVLFPGLFIAVAWVLARLRELSAFRTFVMAVVIDYALSLPFFLLFPVPERWSFSGSGAVLLSDRWTSMLIEVTRPLSGLDNCFPSFHVSLTVIMVFAAFIYRLPLRRAILAVGGALVLSTFVLGIHWLADIVAGAAVGAISVDVALRLERRWSLAAPAEA